MYHAALALCAKSLVYRVRDRFLKCYSNYITSFSDAIYNMPISFLVLSLVYLVFQVTCYSIFETHPSLVPLAELITVIRVCSTNSSYYEFFNATFIIPGNETIGEKPVEVEILIDSKLTGNGEIGICSPRQPYILAFQRALVCCFSVVFEIFLYYYLYTLSLKTRDYLLETSSPGDSRL